eukprot:CAMPEP_0119285580 /NCGR_PEP_ID=MMETSP1329-20130426/32458_1 /TAXON_ID=114041 /ORGANISM="Genus nov. species nov., Strain RCC1024" /LENGTH=521 /DNA_ID=CAMNT_0007286291 /DNA_START=151 /DNA_END=1713 /DNA_ORIENTATION=+
MLRAFIACATAAALVPPARRAAPRGAALQATQSVDVAVVGAGPAGSVLAFLLAERSGLEVALVDGGLEKPWPNNYGVWEEEWQALGDMLPELGLEDCVLNRWAKTDCFFGGSWDKPMLERTELPRAYLRVDRERLRSALRAKSAAAGVRAVDALVAADEPARWCANVLAGASHDAAGSTLALTTGDELRATVVVDATGAESRLTTRRGPEVGDSIPPPGFQVAYGFEAICSALGPYQKDNMLLFDYRTDHLSDAEAKSAPTFMYAMPLEELGNGRQRVFFEETSLVARPGVSLADCERRAFARLEHIGVKIEELCKDEPPELCYIPMGGPRPDPGQRIVAFGAAAALVHPATGYQLCRCLAAAPAVAAALGSSLEAAPADADRAARAAYGALWNRKTSLQREFALFGGEFLMTLDAEALRGWFAGFFALDEAVWAGFLAGWPGLPGNENHETRLARLWFGVSLLPKLPPPIAFKLAAFILTYSLEHGTGLLRSVVPFFGDGEYFTAAGSADAPPVGDAAVK